MMRCIACLLLTILLAFPSIPAKADDSLIPYSLNVLSTAQEESFVVDGYYADRDYYVSVSGITQMLGGEIIYTGSTVTDFTIERGMRSFRIVHKQPILQESDPINDRWHHDTNVPLLLVNGDYHVSMTEFLRYCDMHYELSPDGQINLIVYDHYTLNDVIRDLADINDIACEYVADLKQWCFVIGQQALEADANGEFPVAARTCLSFNQGHPVVVARYIYDERVE